MRKLILIMIAIVGSACTFTFVNLFVLEVSIIQYVCIELIISGFHWLYNKAKIDVVTNSN